jgi:hypothetical protein
MSWSYSGDPSLSDADAVRFEIPDTDESTQLVSDEEIEYALAEESGVRAAAARCCESIARRYAMQADVATGDTKVTYSKAAENLAARAKELRALSTSSVPPFAGGTSVSDKTNRSQDEDRTPGAFTRGQFDNPSAGL